MRISEPTRLKVLRAARELDYRPNLMARSLRTQSTQTIGLIADTIVTGFVQRRDGSGAVWWQQPPTGITCSSLVTPSRTPQSRTNLIEDLSCLRQVDGFIYAHHLTRRRRTPSRAARTPQQVAPELLRSVEGHPPLWSPTTTTAGRSAARVLLCGAGPRVGIHVVGETPPRVVAARERMDQDPRPHLGQGRNPTRGTSELHLWWPESAFDATSSPPRPAAARPRALICSTTGSRSAFTRRSPPRVFPGARRRLRGLLRRLRAG